MNSDDLGGLRDGPLKMVWNLQLGSANHGTKNRFQLSIDGFNATAGAVIIFLQLNFSP